MSLIEMLTATIAVEVLILIIVLIAFFLMEKDYMAK